MAGRVILVRHGLSSHGAPRGWLSSADIDAWRVKYDAAGIHADSRPSDRARQIADQSHIIVASDLTRAIESAARIAPDRPVELSPLLREVPLPIPQLPVRLPGSVWEGMISLYGMYLFKRGINFGASHDERVAAAAKWLGELASDGSQVLVVTHGAFRLLMARELVTTGWIERNRADGYENWSTWEFERVTG